MARFEMFISKDIEEAELIELICSVGWGEKEQYEKSVVRRSLNNYPFVAHIRNEENQLVGYISAFSDEAFSTFIGELIVHPDYQNKGIGTELLQALEQRHPTVPIYVQPYGEAKDFFLKNGFKTPGREMSVLYKKVKA